MNAPTIKKYKCICEECDPPPPIDGLAAPVEEEEGSVKTSALRKWATKLRRQTRDRRA